MKRHLWVFAVGMLVLPIVLLTIMTVVSNIVVHLLGWTPADGSLGANWQMVLTEALVLVSWLGINRGYLQVPIGWQLPKRLASWWFIAPILVVLIGDATLNPSFSFGIGYVVTAIVMGLGVGITEEYVFRGLLVGYLYRHFRLSAMVTAIVSGIIFGGVHLVNALQGSLSNTIAQVIAAIALGFFFAVIYLLTNSLWLPIIGHSVIDAFDQLAFGTLSNQSGTSLVTGVIYAIVFAGLGWWLLKRHQAIAIGQEIAGQAPGKQLNFKQPSRTAMAIDPVKTSIAIAIPLVELALGALVTLIWHGKWPRVIAVDLIFFIGFAVAIYLYRDVLVTDWRQFKQHLGRGVLIAIAGFLGSYLVLLLVRLVLKPFTTSVAASGVDVLSVQSTGLALVASLTTLMAPFTEEIIFRHVLFYQWQKRGAVTWLMLIVSSVAFGLVHWNNFNGDVLAMIPYMCVGAFYGLIYYFSRNIWQNILTHFLFDFVQILAVMALFIVALVH
ncbi:lysostaphin resistance A-like protein [Secundilactobacillus muriivasis]